MFQRKVFAATDVRQLSEKICVVSRQNDKTATETIVEKEEGFEKKRVERVQIERKNMAQTLPAISQVLLSLQRVRSFLIDDILKVSAI